MRGLTALLALLLAACAARTVEIAPTPTPTHEPGTALVTVLLDLSGARAPSGVAQRNAMQLWLDQQQLRGGPQRIRAKFVDLAGSDAQLLIELRRAAVDDRADAVVIGPRLPSRGSRSCSRCRRRTPRHGQAAAGPSRSRRPTPISPVPP